MAARSSSAAVPGLVLGPVPRLELGPALLQLAQDPPEQPAVHQAGDAPADLASRTIAARCTRDGARPRAGRCRTALPGAAGLPCGRESRSAPAAATCSSPPARGRGPRVDVDDEGDAAGVDPLQPVAEERAERRDGGLERPGLRGPGRTAAALGWAWTQASGSGLGRRARCAGSIATLVHRRADRVIGSKGRVHASFRRDRMTAERAGPGDQ